MTPEEQTQGVQQCSACRRWGTSVRMHVPPCRGKSVAPHSGLRDRGCLEGPGREMDKETAGGVTAGSRSCGFHPELVNHQEQEGLTRPSVLIRESRWGRVSRKNEDIGPGLLWLLNLPGPLDVVLSSVQWKGIC